MRRVVPVLAGIVLTAAVVIAAPPPVTFEASVPLLGLRTSAPVAVFDANGDGHADVVIAPNPGLFAVRVFPGNGDGTFGAMTALTTTRSGIFSMAHARLNADAVDDIVISELGNQIVEVLLSDGAGGHSLSTYPAGGTGTITAGGESATVFDWDDDGDIDIFTFSNSRVYRVRRNDGTGHFADAETVTAGLTAPSQVNNFQVVAADLDGDTDVDVAVATGSTILVFFRQQDGTYAAGPTLQAAGYLRGTLAAGDLDGDGFRDLAWLSFTLTPAPQPRLNVARHASATTFGTPATLTSTSAENAGALAVADLNGDARPEILTPSLLFVNQGDGTFADARALGVPFSMSVAAGDLDGDGTPDVAASGSLGTDTAAATVLLTGPAPSQPVITSISPSSLFRGTADEVVISGSQFDPGATVTFGDDIRLSNVVVESATKIRLDVAVFEDTALGAREVRVENPDGAAGTGTFTVLQGGRVNFISISPSRAHAGDTLDCVVQGTGFLSPADFVLGAGITVLESSVESDETAHVRIAIDAAAVRGPRDLTISNGSGLITQAVSAFTVLPFRSLDVAELRGKLRRGKNAVRNRFTVKGTLVFNAASPDGKFDATTESAVVRVGDPLAPFEIEIAPDAGWKVGALRAEWRTPKKDPGMRARLVLDFAKHTFELRVDRTNLTLSDPSDLMVEFTLGDEPGTTVRRWAPARSGFVLR